MMMICLNISRFPSENTEFSLNILVVTKTINENVIFKLEIVRLSEMSAAYMIKAMIIKVLCTSIFHRFPLSLCRFVDQIHERIYFSYSIR